MMKNSFLKNKKENNQLHNSQSTVISHKVEYTKSNYELEWLIDLTDSKALELIKSLGRHYNRIVEWCGMLIIPRVLLKGKLIEQNMKSALYY